MMEIQLKYQLWYEFENWNPVHPNINGLKKSFQATATIIPTQQADQK